MGLEKDESPGRMKYREAAWKAWRTIRRKRRKEISKESRKIEEFVEPHLISSLIHPEMQRQIVQLTLEGKPVELPLKKYYGIIVPFEKTPPSIICGRFWELRWAFGCPLDCAYCYLRGTNRGKMKPRFVKPTIVLKALNEVFADPEFNEGRPAIFNTGELSDSLMNPKLMKLIVDKFDEPSNVKNHKVLLLSKFGPKNVEFLLERTRIFNVRSWILMLLKHMFVL